ncbi:helix-turn-helix domain-containing protein [Actinomadura sp. DC4]|uniref:helix-turn-helix domain-containing protein n=1 Tax=Actinomadura sp. DC4 TaxID=3055069 RepID=UPI0025AEF06D|nr:helix-turn-helix domain-containing protein [Actinomadura sp. DC4]MDN3355507.1 helix-turn-helix domain-containing protein [Actinomadura sp. DC4]
MGRDFVAQVLTGLADDAVRLYEEGSTIRQVAEKFGTGYGAMRRILRQHTTLRNRGGRRP